MCGARSISSDYLERVSAQRCVHFKRSGWKRRYVSALIWYLTCTHSSRCFEILTAQQIGDEHPNVQIQTSDQDRFHTIIWFTN
jgi:hypothetical protein